jgi:anti-anti-sigma factor
VRPPPAESHRLRVLAAPFGRQTQILFNQQVRAYNRLFGSVSHHLFVRKAAVSALRSEFKGDVLVVYFNDAKILDEAKIQQIGKELMEKVGETTDKKLLLNFQSVTFMSSAMIGKLILLNKKCKADAINVKMCNISPNVMEVFKLMRLNKILDLQGDEEKALASFEKKGWFG